jgi:DNA-binding response OmpR family regulator
MTQDTIVNPNEAICADEHLSLDFVSQSVTLDGHRVRLTRKEYDLLGLMVRHAGEIIPRDELLMEVWSYGPDIRTRTLDVHVRRLRRKLGHYAGGGIETVFGVGYRFQPRHEGDPSNISVFDSPLPASD